MTFAFMRAGSFLAASLFLLVNGVQAQWITQTVELKQGWNAVFLHIDATHASLDSILAADPSHPIQEVWRWNPAGTEQFIDNPLAPVNQVSEWTKWDRLNPGLGLQMLGGDTAYLVRVDSAFVGTYRWSVVGKPVLPRSVWRVDGLNLIGFATSPDSPPRFYEFLQNATALDEVSTEIFQYKGGDLGENNPVAIVGQLLETTPVRRGEAFWIRNGQVFNRYFGPFEIANVTMGSLRFGSSLSTLSFRLRNLSPNALTISASLVESEAAPVGQAAPVDVPPLLLRGNIDFTDLTYGYTNMPVGETQTWTLNGRDQEGSEVEVVLGLDRSSMAGTPGDLFAGILRFTDSLGFSQVDLGISAEMASSTGLWVGNAAITQVGQYLKSFLRDSSGELFADESGRYQVTGVETNLTAVASPTTLRLIVHNPASGAARLLQRVYVGSGIEGQIVLSNSEKPLDPAEFGNARRISAAHLPWSESNLGWSLSGLIQLGDTLTTRVTTPHGDHAANPFLHTYHPDHDNRDASFSSELPAGIESYDIVRDITLLPLLPGDDFQSRTAAGTTLTGIYRETIQLLGGQAPGKQYEVQGYFSLSRVSELPEMLFVDP
ncbi:MAG: hypothetical protein RI897_1348 [Verrucomicrobiota bacterium]